MIKKAFANFLNENIYFFAKILAISEEVNSYWYKYTQIGN